MDAEVLLALAAITISILTFAFTARETHRIELRSRMPVLAFVWDTGESAWYVRNVGNGPALNITIGQRDMNGWFNPVRVPAISRDGEFKLWWLGQDGDYALGARYNDFLAADQQAEYFAYCINDTSLVFRPRQSPKWALSRDVAQQAQQHWLSTLSSERPTSQPRDPTSS